MTIKDYVALESGTFEGLFTLQAAAHAEKPAIICEGELVNYSELDRLVNRVAAALQRHGVELKNVVAICAASSIAYMATFLGILRAGAVVAPLPAAATAAQLSAMVADCGASHLFQDSDVSSRVDIAMLVPVQYRRILDVPGFDAFNLTAFHTKFATSAPFSAELKAEVLRRWPGGLVEYYSMTEGGRSCKLAAHEHPGKLHTVGQPIAGNDMKVIDDAGRILPPGSPGEIVGRSVTMMSGYHNLPEKTKEALWLSPEGLPYVRTGDLGMVDADGFFTLIGRKKDMIISGGMNIYPIDLERSLLTNPAVAEAAVVGAPSFAWGETPVAFVTIKHQATARAEEIRDLANAALGKMQRVGEVRIIDVLPRNALGKVLKRELLGFLAAEA